MKLSKPQVRGLQSINIAEEMHGNSDWHEEIYVIPGWFQQKKHGVRSSTINVLCSKGLIEKHPEWYLYRITATGAALLRNKGHKVNINRV